MESGRYRIWTYDLLRVKHNNTLKLLNKLSVSELAELSGFSKSYLSQVKTGKLPPSDELLNRLAETNKALISQVNYLELFLASRKAMVVTNKTLDFYRDRLCQYASCVDYTKANKSSVEKYLNTIKPNTNGFATRHASYRAIKTFHIWLERYYSIENPAIDIEAPILGKPILPSLSAEQVQILIDKASCIRDKADLSPKNS